MTDTCPQCGRAVEQERDHFDGFVREWGCTRSTAPEHTRIRTDYGPAWCCAQCSRRANGYIEWPCEPAVATDRTGEVVVTDLTPQAARPAGYCGSCNCVCPCVCGCPSCGCWPDDQDDVTAQDQPSPSDSA